MSLLAGVELATQCVFRRGASNTFISARRVGLWTSFIAKGAKLHHPISTGNLRTDQSVRIPLNVASWIRYERVPQIFGRNLRDPGRRSFSYSSRLRRRWMERQQLTGQNQPYQQPINQHHPYQQPQHFQLPSWKPPTTPQRAYIATYGLIGLFIAVWCAHNYAEGGSALPNGIPLPKPPGWDSISDFLGFKKSKPPFPIRGPQKPSSAALEIKTNFSSAALSYRTSDYPPALTLNANYPFYASLFSHFEPLHLAINSYWTYAIVPPLMMMIGIPRTLTIFLIGGISAAEIQCNADKAYALNRAPKLFQYIKAAKKDPDPNGTLGAQHVGSSGALFALGSVRALASKQRGWRLFAAFAVSLDAVGYYMDLDTGVSYSTHLGGVVAGALIWFGWLRWTKVVRMAAGRL